MPTRLSAALLALSLALASPALAQSKAPAQSPDSEPALKGPTVAPREAAPSRGKSPFGGKATAKKPGDRPATAASMQNLMRALDSAALSPAQAESARRIASEFEASVTAFKSKNKTELESLRGRLSADERAALDRMIASGRPLKVSKTGFEGKRALLNKKSDSGSQPRPAPTDKSELVAVRTRLIEIYGKAPKAADAQSRIFALLTPEQTAAVNAALEKSRPDRAKRAADGKTAPAKRHKSGKSAPRPGTDKPKSR